MAYPIVAATVNTANNSLDGFTTAKSYNLPSSIVSGNLLVLFIQTGGGQTVTTPSGWTELFQADGAGGVIRLTCIYRVADGSEGSTVSISLSANTRSAYIGFRITGNDGAIAPSTSSNATGNSTSPNPSTVTPSWGSAENLYLAVLAEAGATISSAPSGYSNLLTANTSTSEYIGTAELQATSSSEDPGAFTISSSQQWGARVIAIKPNAGLLGSLMMLDVGV
jgi:hypothetical protein